MSVIGKSNHPVEIKRINVRVWTLRDEIEAAIDQHVAEAKAAGAEPDLEAIKAFYNLKKHPIIDEMLAKQNQESEEKKPEGEEAPKEGEEAKTPEEKPAEEEKKEEEAEAPKEGEEDKEEAEGEEKAEGEDKEAPKEEELPEDIKRLVFSPKRSYPSEDKMAHGFSLLTDVNMDEMLIFLNKNFILGQSVVVEFMIPTRFCLSADIRYSNNYAMRSRVISENKAEYRLQMKWTFSMKGERTTLRHFLKAIVPNLPAPSKAKAAPVEEVEDFDDLGL